MVASVSANVRVLVSDSMSTIRLAQKYIFHVYVQYILEK